MGFKPHFGICSNPSCRRERFIATKDGFCQMCRHLKVQNRKSKRTTGITKLSGTEKRNIFSSLKKKFREPTGEAKTFLEIWEKRPHRSQLSGHPITEFNVFCFAHILSKGTYRKFRLVEENILLITSNEHIQQHNGTLPERYKKIFSEKAQKLKQQYYGLQK